MMLSRDDRYIIDQTNRFFELLRAGRIDPENAEGQLTNLTGDFNDYPEGYLDRWEMLIIGTIAHNASQDLGSFPIIICDWTKDAPEKRSRWVGERKSYWWQKDMRPKRRPKPPHRIDDHELTRLANKTMGRASTEGQVVVVPLVADYEGRSVFEIALLAVFPVWGAWAFRHRVNVTRGHPDVAFRRMLHDDYEWRERAHRPKEREAIRPLHKWIVKNMPNFDWSAEREDEWKFRAVQEASTVSVPLLRDLAERYSQK
jgi:hypothetical protein